MNEIKSDGLKGLRLKIPAPSFEVEKVILEGRSGEVVLDRQLKPRQIEAEFYMLATNYADSLLLRDEVYNLVAQGDFYIAESKLPHKLWRVYVEEGFEPERLALYMQTFTLPLVAPSGAAESRAGTLTPLTFEEDAWQFGQGLITEEPKYIHNVPTFKVYNAGAIEINPRFMPLVIKFIGVSSNLTITNKTTGDAWRYDGTTNADDVIKIDGVRSTKNETGIFSTTNKKLVSIAPGWNDFEITGATGPLEASFDFKYYYY